MADNHRAWQANIAHAPQAIFLADSTVSENIAFGVPKDQIDQIRVLRAAHEAQIADIIVVGTGNNKPFLGSAEPTYLADKASAWE